jgi:hypothetical protein
MHLAGRSVYPNPERLPTAQQYAERSRRRSQAQSDDNTWRFLTLLAEEQQQDGLLLQSVLEEIRNADKAGLGMEQTDRRLMAFVGEAQKRINQAFSLCQGERVCAAPPGLLIHYVNFSPYLFLSRIKKF